MAKHYYWRSGDPAYEIPKASGKGVKNPTITDARKLGLVPSVTTILGDVIRKVAVERWSQSKILRAAYDAQNVTLPFQQWSAMVKDKAFSSVEDAKDEGTQIHAVVESIINNDESVADYEMDLDPAFYFGFAEKWDELDLEVAGTEISFAHPLGYGGKFDVSAWDKDGNDVYVDWKTRETKGRDILWYDELPWQLVAYAEGDMHRRGMPLVSDPPRLISVVISRDEQGRVEHKEYPPEKYMDYLDCFFSAKKIWEEVNGYCAGWE